MFHVNVGVGMQIVSDPNVGIRAWNKTKEDRDTPLQFDTTTLQYRHMRCNVSNQNIRFHIQSAARDLPIPIITCKLSNDTQLIILQNMF